MNHVARQNGWTPFVNMQCQYNLLYREEEREMFPYCHDQGIAVTAFSPLARGWLSGSKKVRSQTDASFALFHGDALDLEICAKVEAIATERGTTMAEIALAWVYAKEAICCPIIGASSVSQLENNVKALDLELTLDEIEALDQLYSPRDVINDHVPEPMSRYFEGKSDGTG
jgi:aryl-alcohol dehydrogenase-like predicted oxidoreductase